MPHCPSTAPCRLALRRASLDLSGRTGQMLRGFRVALVLAMATCGVQPGLAQTPPPAATSAAQPADLFDFWVGDWRASWTNANGTQGEGRNRVSKSLDGAVIEEHFDTLASNPPPLLKGRSLSVLERRSGKWRQAWADNQGGFIVLTASQDGERRIFATDWVLRDGKTLGQRMVFHAIAKDSFTWDWESTADGGKTWAQQWRIQYVRRAAP